MPRDRGRTPSRPRANGGKCYYTGWLTAGPQDIGACCAAWRWARRCCGQSRPRRRQCRRLQRRRPPSSAPAAQLDPRWLTAFDAPAAAPPGFDANSAYVPLRGGGLVAIDLDTGGLRWTLPAVGVRTPATGGGAAIYLALERSVRPRAPATGATSGKTPLPAPLAAAPSGHRLADRVAGQRRPGGAARRRRHGRVEPGPRCRPRRGAGAGLDSLILALTDGRVVAVSLATGVSAGSVGSTAPSPACSRSTINWSSARPRRSSTASTCSAARSAGAGGSAPPPSARRSPTSATSTRCRSTTCYAPLPAATATCGGRRRCRPARPAAARCWPAARCSCRRTRPSSKATRWTPARRW